jgi:hypothetical protein
LQSLPDQRRLRGLFYPAKLRASALNKTPFLSDHNIQRGRLYNVRQRTQKPIATRLLQTNNAIKKRIFK